MCHPRQVQEHDNKLLLVRGTRRCKLKVSVRDPLRLEVIWVNMFFIASGGVPFGRR